MAYISTNILTKHPDETLIYNVDFSPVLNSDETIALINSIEVTLRDNVVNTDLTITNNAISSDGKELSFDIAGGTHNYTYKIIVNTKTNNEQTMIAECFLAVEE
jgi:hypothetical protein